MQKIIIDILIVVGIIAAYLFMAAFQPGLNDIIETVNSTSNYTGIWGMQGAVNAFPLYAWFLPALVGLIAVVVNHKQG